MNRCEFFKNHWGKLLLSSLTFLLLVGIAAAGWFWIQVETPRGSAAQDRIVQIPEGAGVIQISRILEREALITSPWLFQLYVRFAGTAGQLKAGEYRFQGPHSISDLADKLHRGDFYYHRVTIPEGRDMQEIAEIFVAAGFGSIERFSQIFQNDELISGIDPEASNLEGYLFPDTYHFLRGTSEQEIVRTMVNRFQQSWTEAEEARARELQMTVREVVTLASLIEKETGLPEERPLVSSVFHNRLALNMRLACDPTVIYAVKQVKEYDGVINQSDLALDSPYNTYVYPGLPPGPIANPGKEAIRSALYPEKSDYLFFVSRNDGSHYFSTSYRDHSRAVQKYQR